MRPRAASPLEESARALLVEMLASVRHSRDTPLYFGIDAPRIVAAALEKTAAGLPANALPLEDPGCVLVAIDRIASGALACRDVLVEGVREPLTAHTSGAAQAPALLVAWLGRAHRCMVGVHPLAADILGLRVEGETSREIAERLDLGLRLTERITADMRTAWAAGAAR